MKRIRFLVTVVGILVFCCCNSTSQNQAPTISTVEPQEFIARMSTKSVQLIDVRTAEEVAEGKIPGAKNLDFFAADFDKKLGRLEKDRAVFVYCALGGRSLKTANKLKNMGFVEIYNLDGGFTRWTEENMLTE